MFIPNINTYNQIPEKKIIFFSGAGISQPSGIQTFRDSDGLWENHDIKEICNEMNWKKNFDIVHQFYNNRRKELEKAKPNIAHNKIFDIYNKYGNNNVINITQNVDDLFEKAGFKNDNIMHLHGQLTKMECTHCGEKWNIKYNLFDIEKDKCPNCKSLKSVKPHIVFFYGQAPMYKYMKRAFNYGVNKDTIIIVIGTMGNVVPIDFYLKDLKCKKILCNMNKSNDINDNQFDKIYYENIETAIFKIEKDIAEYWC